MIRDTQNQLLFVLMILFLKINIRNGIKNNKKKFIKDLTNITIIKISTKQSQKIIM